MVETLNIAYRKRDESRISEVDFSNIQFGQIYSDHMFIADYRDKEWKDFRITPYEHLSLSPASPAIHYGQAIFEGLKAYKDDSGNILVFRPLDNYKRLNKSAERMCIPDLPEAVFMDGLKQLLTLDRDWIPSNPGTSLYIRPFTFSSEEYIGIRPSEFFKFMIITCPVSAYYTKPVRVKIETKYTRAIQGGTGFAKAAGNYASSLYPAKLAQDQGYHQLIWTDGKEHKYIEESGTMNVMFVIDGVLVTPPTGDTILKGITRDSVLQLARSWNMPVEERKITVDELIGAIKSKKLTEAFGAGTAATIAQIELIGHDGTDYQLPDIETREFSNKVGKALDDIRTGRAEDPFNWVYRI